MSLLLSPAGKASIWRTSIRPISEMFSDHGKGLLSYVGRLAISIVCEMRRRGRYTKDIVNCLGMPGSVGCSWLG